MFIIDDSQESHVGNDSNIVRIRSIDETDVDVDLLLCLYKYSKCGKITCKSELVSSIFNYQYYLFVI